MVDIAIFGTGASGERAWQAAWARGDVRVVCFADNDRRKHGTTVHGRRVVSAEQLTGESVDFVVVASMYAGEIRRQLRALGFADDVIVTPDPGTWAEKFASLVVRKRTTAVLPLDDGTSVAARDLPSTLILTYDTLNSTHGTGVLLQRYFADFPREKLFSVCHTTTGQPWLESSLALPSTLGAAERTAMLREALLGGEFTPELVYATAFNENDLELLEVVLDVLPDDVPIVQHFMDYIPHNPGVFDERFMRLSSRLREVWALTEGMARELQRRYTRPVKYVTALHQESSTIHKTAHADISSDFRAVMLGKVWQPSTLPVLRRVWAHCRAEYPQLRPIDWYVHPLRVQALIEAGYELGDEIVWRGFYTGNSLKERLAASDLALLPFNMDASAQDNYTRFSFPSRLTEVCGAGLPVFAIASPDTEPARFLTSRECGLAVAGCDQTIGAQLMNVIRDRERRQCLGARSRHVAETEFAIGPFYQQLLGSLVRLSRGRHQAQFGLEAALSRV